MRVHLHRHVRPGLGGQRDLPVDPRGLAASVALRHLPHADQRVRPAPQHQLLQVPDLGPVTVLRRLEDPAAVAAVRSPRGVASRRCPTRGPSSSGPFTPRAAIATSKAIAVIVSNLSFGSGCSGCFVFKGSPAHVSLLSQPGTRPGIRPVIRDRPAEGRSTSSRFPVAFRLPAFASWASCSRHGTSAFLTVGLPPAPRTAGGP